MELWLPIIELCIDIGLIIHIKFVWITDDYEPSWNLNRIWANGGSIVILPELKGFIVSALYLPVADVPWHFNLTREFWSKILRSC